MLLLFPMGKCDRAPVYWSDGQNIKQKRNPIANIYINLVVF